MMELGNVRELPSDLMNPINLDAAALFLASFDNYALKKLLSPAVAWRTRWT